MSLKRPSTEIVLLRILAESEEDLVEGRVAPVEDTFDEIRKSLEERLGDL